MPASCRATGSDTAIGIHACKSEAALAEGNLSIKCFEAALPDCVRENAPIALNLQVLGRSLAAIGDLFVFDALPFIK